MKLTGAYPDDEPLRRRLVFFGLNGSFSTIVLEHLVRSGFAPALVVHGLERNADARRPQYQRVVAQPSLWNRAQVKWRRKLPDTYEYELTQIALELGIDVIRTTHVNERRTQTELRRLAPDVYVVAGFSHLLSPETLRCARFGGLNLHPGGLPEERGPAPLFWALKEGRNEIKWTLHMLDDGEDTGDIITSGSIRFEPGATGSAILAQCAHSATPAIIRSLRALLDGDLVRFPQPAHQGLRKPRPKFQDGQLDLSRSASEVFTFVAACAPTYSLFAECAEDRFFIRRAVSYDSKTSSPFEWALTGDRLLLRCNPGTVELELKEEGALFAPEYQDDFTA